MRDLLNDTNRALLIKSYSDESKCSAVPEYNPNFDMYYGMEDSGVLDTLAAYNEDNILIGFAVSITYLLPKYTTLATSIEFLFVLKEYRAGGTGLNLIKEIERLGVERGAESFFVSAPTDGSLDKIAERSLGLTKTHTIYSKRL